MKIGAIILILIFVGFGCLKEPVLINDTDFINSRSTTSEDTTTNINISVDTTRNEYIINLDI